jgi:hypothetical protein
VPPADLTSDFPVALTYEDQAAQPFWTIDAGRLTTYSVAGEYDGATVFGRGVCLTLRATNRSENTVSLRGLRVLTQWSPQYPARLRYRKIVAVVPVPPLPFASGQANVRLGEDALPEGQVVVRGTRGELGPAGGPDSARDVHVVIEAAVAGLWACHVIAESSCAGQTWVTETPLSCLVLSRGK